MNLPPLDVSAIDVAAVGLHEMYTALVRAGFTEQQALTIVIGAVTHALNPGKE